MLPQLLLDTVVMRALGAALSAIFLIGAWTKLRDQSLAEAMVAHPVMGRAFSCPT